MTRDEALVEARRRWGPAAFVRIKLTTDGCEVGWLSGSHIRAIEGSGLTWEDAFADADLQAEADNDWDGHS